MPKLIAGLVLLVATIAAARGLAAQAAHPVGAGSPPPVYASLASARSGVAREVTRAQPDTNATGVGSVRRRAAHSAIGAGAGLVVGAVVGALVGYGLDQSDHSEAMFPAAFELGAIGAAAGLVIGGVAGALVR